MDQELIKNLLSEHFRILDAASQVLLESKERVEKLFKSKKTVLSIEEKESCEALTARFARLCDFLFQRAFRTIDRIELQDEGSVIDRLNRMEKKKIIHSATLWREIRELRNDIAHEYLIEQSDRVLHEALKHSAELLQTVKRYKQYIQEKKYL